MLKTRFDLDCENFDYYFAKQIPFITPQAKDQIPKDVTFKLFRRGGEFNEQNTSKLGFIAKLFILWRCLRKRWYLVVEDEKEGLSVEQFVQWHEDLKKREYGAPQSNGWIARGNFVLGSKEVCNAFSYLNRLNTAPSYNYLIKGKNKIKNHAEDWNRQMQYICKFLICFDRNKKIWVSEMGVSIPEWYTLVYLYTQNQEINGSIIHKEIFRRAYQSSPTKIKRCFGVLQSKGYVQKTGEGRGAKMSITPLGIDVVNSILTKYALNC